MTEAELQNTIIDEAHWRGWSTYHTYDSRRSNPGFPDLVLWRRDRLIFAELKSPKGKLRRDQGETLNGLCDTGAEVYIWRPADLERISTILA